MKIRLVHALAAVAMGLGTVVAPDALAQPEIFVNSNTVVQGNSGTSIWGYFFTTCQCTDAYLFWYPSYCNGEPWNCNYSSYSNLGVPTFNGGGVGPDTLEYCPSDGYWYVWGWDEFNGWSNEITLYCETFKPT